MARRSGLSRTRRTRKKSLTDRIAGSGAPQRCACRTVWCRAPPCAGRTAPESDVFNTCVPGRARCSAMAGQSLTPFSPSRAQYVGEDGARKRVRLHAVAFAFLPASHQPAPPCPSQPALAAAVARPLRSATRSPPRAAWLPNPSPNEARCDSRCPRRRGPASLRSHPPLTNPPLSAPPNLSGCRSRSATRLVACHPEPHGCRAPLTR